MNVNVKEQCPRTYSQEPKQRQKEKISMENDESKIRLIRPFFFFMNGRKTSMPKCYMVGKFSSPIQKNRVTVTEVNAMSTSYKEAGKRIVSIFCIYRRLHQRQHTLLTDHLVLILQHINPALLFETGMDNKQILLNTKQMLKLKGLICV